MKTLIFSVSFFFASAIFAQDSIQFDKVEAENIVYAKTEYSVAVKSDPDSSNHFYALFSTGSLQRFTTACPSDSASAEVPLKIGRPATLPVPGAPVQNRRKTPGEAGKGRMKSPLHSTFAENGNTGKPLSLYKLATASLL
jgi:hypothetical protein